MNSKTGRRAPTAGNQQIEGDRCGAVLSGGCLGLILTVIPIALCDYIGHGVFVADKRQKPQGEAGSAKPGSPTVRMAAGPTSRSSAQRAPLRAQGVYHIAQENVPTYVGDHLAEHFAAC